MGADTQPGHGLGWKLVAGCLGQHGDLLDSVGVRAQGVADTVAGSSAVSAASTATERSRRIGGIADTGR